MRYADTLLAEGEVVILRARRHWLSVFIEARAALALWLVSFALIAAVFFLDLQRPLSDWLSIAALAFLLLGLVLFGYRLWQWWAEDYLVTNRRLMKVTGILNKSSSDSGLEKINDAILHQNVLGRILNFGDMDIVTASGEMAVDYFRMLQAAKQFKRVMLNQKHALEMEYRYAASAPSPPLRASPVNMLGESSQAGSRPSPHASVADPDVTGEEAQPRAEPANPQARVSAGDRRASGRHEPEHERDSRPDDDQALAVTQTLARLADLRDRGAITLEDYELKKDELLRRL